MYIQLDYFHPSLVGHQHMAKALWNSMLTPAASKKTYFNSTEPFVCPDSSTLLYTNWSKIVTARPNYCMYFVLLAHELKLFTAYFLVLELAIAACCIFFLPYVSVYEGLATPTTLNWSMHNFHCGANFASFFSAWWNWHSQHRLLKSNNFKFTVYKMWLQLVLDQSMHGNDLVVCIYTVQMSCYQLAI